MKKWILLSISVITLIAVMCVSVFVLDNNAPTITIDSNPVVACNITKDDLLDYGHASDSNLKSFFIEEDDLLKIAETRKLTYVAIDDSNNVTRKTVSVEVDPKVTSYTIKTIAPLELQVNTKVIGEKYFKLVNGCGQDIDESFFLKGISPNTVGDYETVVSARNHEADKLKVMFTVADYNSPTIILKETEVEEYSNTVFDDAYFINLIDNIKDDKDSSPALINDVITNYKSVLKLNSNTNTLDEGTYTVTYYVIDSDGNSGKTNLKITIED